MAGGDPAGLPQLLGDRRQPAVCRDRADILAIVKLQATVINPAKAMRLVEDCVENRLQVAGRGVDDLQDFGDRLLLFQGHRAYR
jgi:hypothetical protein